MDVVDPNVSAARVRRVASDESGQDAPGGSGDAARKGRTPGRKNFDPEVREAVIAAATRAMEEGGLEAIKARPVAEAADISVGSIYNLFGGLEKLTREVNGRTYDELLKIETGALAQARAAGLDARGQMLALADAYLAFVEAHQTKWQATLAFNRRPQSEPPPKWYVDKELALLRVIEEVIGGFFSDAEARMRHLHARALWASVHGIVTIAVANGFLMQPADESRAQIEIIVSAVARALEARKEAAEA